MRALHCAVEELSRRWKKPLPENNGKPWTEELDDELCRLFDGGMKKKDLVNLYYSLSLNLGT